MRLESPGWPVTSRPKISSSLGRRKSAETTITLLPLMAQAAARLAATNVLPSPGSGLVTTRTGKGVSSRMTRRLVRSSRMDSAIRDWGAWSMAMATLPDRTSLSSGSSARIGDSVTEAMSGVVRRRVSNWSLARAIPQPDQQPGDQSDDAQLGLAQPGRGRRAARRRPGRWRRARPSVMFSCSVCRALTVWVEGADLRGDQPRWRLGLEPGDLGVQTGQGRW